MTETDTPKDQMAAALDPKALEARLNQILPKDCKMRYPSVYASDEDCKACGLGEGEACAIWHGEVDARNAALRAVRPQEHGSVAGLVDRLRGADPDHVTPVDALRLHDENPAIFEFSAEDAEGVLALIDEAADALEALASSGEEREPVAWMLMPERKVLLDEDYQKHKSEHHAGDIPLYAAPPAPEPVQVKAHVTVEYDGFSGDIVGDYTTREGKHGWVVQQDGTRVVHVYGESRVAVAPAPSTGSKEGNDGL